MYLTQQVDSTGSVAAGQDVSVPRGASVDVCVGCCNIPALSPNSLAPLVLRTPPLQRTPPGPSGPPSVAAWWGPKASGCQEGISSLYRGQPARTPLERFQLLELGGQLVALPEPSAPCTLLASVPPATTTITP